jgi:type I restriction enzyme S subunit
MNPNVGVPTLGLGVIRDARIPLPPLPVQRHIVSYLDDLQTKGHALKIMQSETAAELDALMPSILSKAFRGEL